MARCAADSPARAPAWRVALLLALLSTILELALLLFPSRHVSPAWVFPEEQHRGNIAREILDGPLLAVQDYQHAPNVGGSVVVGVLAVPFVQTFGDSVASVRAVPILFNLAAVAVLVLLLDRFVSRRAAWIGGILFAFHPPGYSLLAMTAFGTHVENNALTLLALWLYLELHRIGVEGRSEHDPVESARSNAIPGRGSTEEVRGGGREPLVALALGITCGFALYFGYFFAVALVTLLLFELLHDKLFWLRRWFRFALTGFLVGFTPWIAYNLSTSFRGLWIYDAPITERVSLENMLDGGLARLALFFGDQLPHSFFFRGLAPAMQAPAAWFSGLTLLALVAVLAWHLRAPARAAVRTLVSLRERPRDLGAPFLFCLYVPVYLAAFMAADVGLGSVAEGIAHDGRYTAPLIPFLCLSAACALDRLLDGPAHLRWIARAVPVSLATLFAVGTLALCDVTRAGEALRTPGTSSDQLARWMAWTWRTDLDRLDRIVEGVQTRRTPEVADATIFTLAQGLKWGMRTQDRSTSAGRRAYERNVRALRHLHQRVADPYRPYCEMPVPGEPIYASADRGSFWSRYRHRERAARVRQTLALATP